MTSSAVRRRLRVGAALAAAAPLAAAAERQRDPTDGERRFVIVAVTDSTVSLLTPRARWMRPGTYGIAVDPRSRDVLVGRLRVLSRQADTAVAMVTGQTTRLTVDHVAIFRRPLTPALQQRLFWGGVLAGVAAAVGAVVLHAKLLCN